MTPCNTGTGDLAAEVRRGRHRGRPRRGSAGLVTAGHGPPGATVLDVGVTPHGGRGWSAMSAPEVREVAGLRLAPDAGRRGPDDAGNAADQRGRGGRASPSARSRLPTFVPAVLVAVIALVGLGLVLTQHWRRGAVLLGVALLVAAALRFAVPAERVGLLAIRGKVVDVLCYSGFGVAMVLLAATITRGSLTP